jgi:glycerol kinase
MSASTNKFVLALDQGTTSSRAIVFDRSGKAVSAAQQEFPQIFPGPGKICGNSCCAVDTALPERSNTIARLDVVP